MLKKILAALLAFSAALAFASVDVNKATEAELEGVKGIGPAIAGKILDERKKGSFKDWQDMVDRVKGVGDGNAAKFSTEGLTVNGAPFAGAPAKPVAAVAKKEAAPAAPAPAPTAAPAAATTPTAAPATVSAADAKAAAKKEKEDKKAAAKQAKADKKAAKAAAAASAASAAKK